MKNKKKTAPKKSVAKKKAVKKKNASKRLTKAEQSRQALQYLVDAEENETRLMIASSMGLIDE